MYTSIMMHVFRPIVPTSPQSCSSPSRGEPVSRTCGSILILLLITTTDYYYYNYYYCYCYYYYYY